MTVSSFLGTCKRSRTHAETAFSTMLDFFKKSSSVVRSKCGGFDVIGGVMKEVISRRLRLSLGRMFPLTYSGIFSMV